VFAARLPDLCDICDFKETKSKDVFMDKEGVDMRRRLSAFLVVFSIVALFLLMAGCSLKKGEVKQYQIQSKILSDGGETAQRTLSVYLPEGYNTSEASYPVLYLIHGFGGNNTTLLGGGTYGHMSEVNVSVIVDRLIQKGKIKPLIVVCPDVNRTWNTSPTGLIAPYDEYLLHDVVSFVDATFRTIPKRESRAIAGHSQGGYDALYIAFMHPEVFSIAGGLSSYGLENTLTANLGALLKAHDEKPYPIQFWLYSGTKDEYHVTQPNRDFVKALKENGLPTLYTEDDGDHTNKVGKKLDEFIELLPKFLKW
jgi:enterochelin esterase-like enzyme